MAIFVDFRASTGLAMIVSPSDFSVCVGGNNINMVQLCCMMPRFTQSTFVVTVTVHIQRL